MSAPLLHLPGQAFTVWTRPGRPTPKTAVRPAISLPGKQFTVWTRPGTKPSRVAPVAASVPAKSTPATTAGKSWLSRAGWLAVPFLGALWYSDHQSQNKQAEALRQHHLMEEARKVIFQNQASNLSQERANLTSQLEAAETKQRELNLETGRLKTSLSGVKDELAAKTLAAQGAIETAAAVKQELAAVKSGFGEKESAWNNSLAVLKAEASKAKQTLEQRELEMKDQIVKVEADRAAAQRVAAEAAARLTELESQLDALRKKLPAAPAK